MELVWLWFGVAGLTIVLELSSGTFYLLMVALGMLAGGVVALLGVGLPGQFVVAAVVAGVAVWLLRRSRFGRRRIRGDIAQDASVNLDIGERLQVAQWQPDGRTRAMYRGAEWDVELQPGEPAQAGWYEIRAIRGTRLYVAFVGA